MEQWKGTGENSSAMTSLPDTAFIPVTACTATRTSTVPVNATEGSLPFGLHWMFLLLPVIMVPTILITFGLWKRCGHRAQSLQCRRKRTLSEEGTHLPIPTIVQTPVLPMHEVSPSWHWLQDVRSSVRSWRKNRSMQHYSTQDMAILEMIKDGVHGRFYRSRLNHGNCKGHKLITCKVFREGVIAQLTTGGQQNYRKTLCRYFVCPSFNQGSRGTSASRPELEAIILKKVGYHKSILQLLDYNTSHEPFMLLLENVSYGSLKKFFQIHRGQLATSENLHCQLTVIAYHIALGMEHIASRKVLHRDLALRNILIDSFPYECKIADFGLAKDLSRQGNIATETKNDVPLRWYPPEYFQDREYNAPSEVWSFGILLWELETLGCSPYPELESPEEVVFYICSGQRMEKPNRCRDEIFNVMEQCWVVRPAERPSFTTVAKYLEGVVAEDADYIQLEECELENGT